MQCGNVPAGFPFVSCADVSVTHCLQQHLLDFDSTLAPWWDVRRRALVVSLYAGLDAPPLHPLSENFEPCSSAAHYLKDELPTAPATDTSMQLYLLQSSQVQPRKYEEPAFHADGTCAQFTNITRKTLALEVDMPLAALRGYLSTWSGYNTFLKDSQAVKRMEDPLETLCDSMQATLLSARGLVPQGGDTVTVSWPCALLLATKA